MRWRKLFIVFASGMLFVPGFVQSIRVTVAWSKGELAAGPWEWLWIGLPPVWVFVYFRYYSIFRTGCRAWTGRSTPYPQPEDKSTGQRLGPRAP